MLFVQVSVGIWLSNKEDCERMYRLYHRLCNSTMPLNWLHAATKFKTTKINFEGLFRLVRKLEPTKITRHTVLAAVSFLVIHRMPIFIIHGYRFVAPTQFSKLPWVKIC